MKARYFKLNRFLLALSVALGLASSTALADDPTQAKPDDLSSLDLKSLLDMKVITASKFSEKLSDAPGIISVVTQDELVRFGGVTLREVLERVPGLMGTSAYFTDRSIVAIRGDQTKINGGHILFLINGRPIREILEGGIVSDLLESFPVNALEKIEVVKGPGSVLYGSNAFSGVVNLITKKADTNDLVVSAFGGERGGKGGSGQVMFKRGDLDIFGAAQFHEKPDWTTSYRYHDPLNGDPFAGPALQDVTIHDRSSGSYLGVNYKGLSFMSAFTEWHTPSFVRGNVGTDRWRRGFADLGYSRKVSNHWDTSFNLTYSRTMFSNPGYPDIGRDSHEVVAEWSNAVTLTGRDQLIFGALFNHIQGSETYYGLGFPIPISGGDPSTEATYAQLDHKLLSTVHLVGGLQYNKIDNVRGAILPRAGVIWNPSARTTVKALYSKAFRAPSINETTLNHPGLEGTPGLLPEKVGTLDIGLTYQGNKFQAGVNYFYSNQTDSITIDASRARWKYVNLGEATFQGVELDGKYYLNKSLFFTGSMLYQTNHDGVGNQNITPIANLGGKAGVSYKSGGLIASVFGTTQGAISGYTNTVNPQPAAFALLNSHLRYDISRFLGRRDKEGIALFVHGDNLTNQPVWLPDWGSGSGDTIPAMRGRTVYFGVELALKRE
jgi:outer membrane receptor protein involved in Fe transport